MVSLQRLGKTCGEDELGCNTGPNHPKKMLMRTFLVGGLEHFLFFHILGIIIPMDYHIFSEGWLNHQPLLLLPFSYENDTNISTYLITSPQVFFMRHRVVTHPPSHDCQIVVNLHMSNGFYLVK